MMTQITIPFPLCSKTVHHNKHLVTKQILESISSTFIIYYFKR